MWNDQAGAQALLRERTRLDVRVRDYRRLESELEDAVGLAELAEAEGDASVLAEAEAQLLALAPKLALKRTEALLSGEADANNCFVEIHAGAGGTESQDWAAILLRMYGRWADRRGFETALIEESPGDEAGIKSSVLRVAGANAYGWLKSESGVHRLVRISPFDASARRHTSFASVWVYPEIDDTIDIEVLDKDLKIDTYRASGAGGQHVNRTDSAVRITHLPSGIVVQCQQERSQHKNRATAMKMLRARLYEQELQKREAERLAREAQKTDIGWGHQIRSYVLQPYQMVKDVRTGVERGDASRVLDGDIDPFLEAALVERVGGEQRKAS